MQYGKVHHFASHFPVLLHAVRSTDGAVLELGTGLYSTPLLHYLCDPSGRRLVSVENDPSYYQLARLFCTANHEVRMTQDWDEPDLLCPFDVVFIDNFPAEQRRLALLKYADLAKFIVVHDTNGRQDRHYHLRDEWKNFAHVLHYGRYFPQTTIVSNSRPIGEIC